MSDVSSLSSSNSRGSRMDNKDGFHVLIDVQATVNPAIRSMTGDFEDVLALVEDETGVEIRLTKRRYVLSGSLDQINHAKVVLEDIVDRRRPVNGYGLTRENGYCSNEQLYSCDYERTNKSRQSSISPYNARGLYSPQNKSIPRGRGAKMEEVHEMVRREYEKLKTGEEKTFAHQDHIYADYKMGDVKEQSFDSDERQETLTNTDAPEETSAKNEVYGVQKYLLESGYYNSEKTTEKTPKEPEPESTKVDTLVKDERTVVTQEHQLQIELDLPNDKDTTENEDTKHADDHGEQEFMTAHYNPEDNGSQEQSKDLDLREDDEPLGDNTGTSDEKPFAEEIMVDEYPWLYMQQEFDKQLDIIKESFAVDIVSKSNGSSGCVTALIIPKGKDGIDLNALFCAREEFVNIYQQILLDCAQEICDIPVEVPAPARQHAVQVTMKKYPSIVLREMHPNTGQYIFIGPSRIAKQARYFFMKDVGMATGQRRMRQQVVQGQREFGSDDQFQKLFLQQQQLGEVLLDFGSSIETNESSTKQDDSEYANMSKPKTTPVLRLYKPKEQDEKEKATEENYDDMPALESITPITDKLAFFKENQTDDVKELETRKDDDKDTSTLALQREADHVVQENTASSVEEIYLSTAKSTAAVLVEDEEDTVPIRSTAAILVEDDKNPYSEIQLPYDEHMELARETFNKELLSVRPEVEVLDSLSTGDYDKEASAAQHNSSVLTNQRKDYEEVHENATLPLRKQNVVWLDDSSDEEDIRVPTDGMPDVLPESNAHRTVGRSGQSASPEKIIKDLEAGGEYKSKKLVDALAEARATESRQASPPKITKTSAKKGSDLKDVVTNGYQKVVGKDKSIPKTVPPRAIPDDSDDELPEDKNLMLEQQVQKDGSVVNTCSGYICSNCVEPARNFAKLKCGHEFCTRCIRNPYRMSRDECPKCGSKFIRDSAPQPEDGKMSHLIDKKASLPHFPKKGSMMITLEFPAGVISSKGGEETTYKKLKITSYLPNNSDGRTIFKKMHSAFADRKLFTVTYVKGATGELQLKPGITMKQDKEAITKEYLSKLSKDLSGL